MGEEPSTSYTFGHLDEESRLRTRVESLWICGSLYRGQELKDCKYRDPGDETRKDEE